MNENNFNLTEVQQIKTYSTNQKHSNTIIGTIKPGESSRIVQSSMGSAKLPSSNSNPRHHPDPEASLQILGGNKLELLNC